MTTSPKEKGLAMCKSPGRTISCSEKTCSELGGFIVWQRNNNPQGSRQLLIRHLILATIYTISSVWSWSVKRAVGFMRSEKGKWEAQMTSKFEENDGDGTARTQSYLTNSDLNSKLEEDMECKGFNDSLKSMFVIHQGDEMLAMRTEPQRRLHKWHVIVKISKSSKLLKQICEADKSYFNRRP